ncbi:17453_t:CDS:1, partial [Rhizophagus irregularis]
YETNSMKENFPYWTSENKVIDKLIRYTQLYASQTYDYLEWFPFETFEMVRYIGSGGFGSVCSEGQRWNWDDGAQEWTRVGPTSSCFLLWKVVFQIIIQKVMYMVLYPKFF